MNAVESNIGKENDFNESCRFIEALVKALQLYGISSRNMVVSLSRVVKALGMNGEFNITPNNVQTVLWDEDKQQQRVHLAMTRSGNYNLAKLRLVIRLAQIVEAGSIQPKEGLVRLRKIMLAPDKYGPSLNALAFVLCGVAFAIITGGSWMDALIGSILSLASFGVAVIAARFAGIAALQELLAAMIASFLGSVAAKVFPGINPMAVTVCAIITFVPGFGLTIAPNELMVGNTLSGIIWLTNALVTAFKLVGGAAIGSALAKSAGISVESVTPAASISSVWHWIAVPVFIIALAVLMKVDRRNFLAIILGGWLVWSAMKLGNTLGSWQGTFTGAVALMIYANWYAYKFRTTSAIILLPCVMILLPGVAALNAIYVAETQGIVAGFQKGYAVFATIIAILGGSIVGDILALNKLAKTGKTMMSFLEKI